MGLKLILYLQYTNKQGVSSLRATVDLKCSTLLIYIFQKVKY